MVMHAQCRIPSMYYGNLVMTALILDSYTSQNINLGHHHGPDGYLTQVDFDAHLNEQYFKQACMPRFGITALYT